MLKRLRSALLAVALVLVIPAIAEPSGQEVPQSPREIDPPLIGDTFPTLTLKNGEGADVDVQALLAKKPAVIIIYRGGW